MKLGGTIDLTAGDHPETGVAAAVATLLDQGIDPHLITMSSDAFGSQPRFDALGHCIGLTYVSPAVLHIELSGMVKHFGIPLETALLLLTENPARMLKLQGIKGCIDINADADLIVYDASLAIDRVYAKGKLAVEHGEAILKGRFEA